MRWRAIALTCALVCASDVGREAQSLAPQTTPVLVELFTSEGCSSCPPADTLLQSLIESNSGIVALGEHVDYWDRLGWRDRFSSAVLTNRQQAYARALDVDSVYTPQMVVDGRDQFVGSDAAAARRSIGRAAAAPHARLTLSVEPVTRSIAGGGTVAAAGDRDTAGRIAVTVEIAGLPAIARGDRADVTLAITESSLRTDVRGGENRGRHLTHAAVVRQMTVVGEAAASASTSVVRSELTLGVGWQRDHLTVVAFVQERLSRRILGAAARPLL